MLTLAAIVIRKPFEYSKLTVNFMNFVTGCIICWKDLPVTVCTLNQMQHILCYHFIF